MATPEATALMRPLTVMQLLPALASGGVERSTLEIAAALTAAGHRAIVVSAGGRLVADLHAVGGEHFTLDIGRKSLLTLRHVFSLRHLMAHYRPDIVHARSRLPAWLGWYARHGLPQPRPAWVTTVHGLNSVNRYSAIMTRGERVICVSDSVRRYVMDNYSCVDPARLRVIERGVNADDFPFGYHPTVSWYQTFYAEHPVLANRRWLLLPGRGTRLKGHVQAIQLVAQLRQRGQDVALLLQGVKEPGRERYLEELHHYATQVGVAEWVCMAAPRRDIRDVMAAAFAVLQLSSKPEAFGRTVAEALSLGKPVLGWDQGGVGELLARGFPDGAVPFDAMDKLVQQAMHWLQHPPVLSPFSPFSLQSMQAATLAVYREVLDAR